MTWSRRIASGVCGDATGACAEGACAAGVRASSAPAPAGTAAGEGVAAPAACRACCLRAIARASAGDKFFGGGAEAAVSIVAGVTAAGDTPASMWSVAEDTAAHDEPCQHVVRLLALTRSVEPGRGGKVCVRGGQLLCRIHLPPQLRHMSRTTSATGRGFRAAHGVDGVRRLGPHR